MRTRAAAAILAGAFGVCAAQAGQTYRPNTLTVSQFSAKAQAARGHLETRSYHAAYNVETDREGACTRAAGRRNENGYGDCRTDRGTPFAQTVTFDHGYPQNASVTRLTSFEPVDPGAVHANPPSTHPFFPLPADGAVRIPAKFTPHGIRARARSCSTPASHGSSALRFPTCATGRSAASTASAVR